MSEVWSQQPAVLWRHPLEFWPDEALPPEARMNALIRLGTYCTLLLAWYYGHWTALLILWGMALAALYYCPPLWTARAAAGAACTAPTPGNPFMNPTAYDWEHGTVAACPQSDSRAVDRLAGGYRDADDLFERNHLERFYTLPQTAHPDNQSDFLQYLYPLPPTCKEENQCLLP